MAKMTGTMIMTMTTVTTVVLISDDMMRISGVDGDINCKNVFLQLILIVKIRKALN